MDLMRIGRISAAAGLAIALGVAWSRADCTGCAAGKAYEEPCLSWWTLPDGERICVEQPGQSSAGTLPPGTGAGVPPGVTIIIREPDLCIFASDVRNGLYRWRACEAVK